MDHLKELFFTSDGRVQLRDLLFGFDGRIPRSKYWLAWLVTCIVYVGWFVLLILVSWLPYVAIVFFFIGFLLTLNSNIAVACKRFHDRGKSVWWALILYFGPAFLGTMGRYAGSAALLFDLASSLLLVWMIVELGCLRGTEGPNKYGPDPLAASPEAGAPT